MDSKINAQSESLDFLYQKFPLRLRCYQAITNYILEKVKTHRHVCVVLYGHPTMYAQPALAAALQAQQKGCDVKILPGISAENCLFADLQINPASHGCQSFEATDFLLRQRSIEITCHVILWQIGSIGNLGHRRTPNVLAMNLLQQQLLRYHAEQHLVILYEAAQYPTFSSRIIKFNLAQLTKQKFSGISTLIYSSSRKKSIRFKCIISIKH